jgi:hypothetical protein
MTKRSFPLLVYHKECAPNMCEMMCHERCDRSDSDQTRAREEAVDDMDDVRWPWAVADSVSGRLVHARDASKIDKYFCFQCREKVIPVKGKTRRAHFRHANECNRGEGFLHKISKQIVYDYFHSMTFVCICSCGSKIEVKEPFSDPTFFATLEDRDAIADYIPDVSIRNGSGKLIGVVEIHHTNPVHHEKAAALDTILGSSWFEVTADRIIDNPSSVICDNRRICGMCDPCSACNKRYDRYELRCGYCRTCYEEAVSYADKWYSKVVQPDVLSSLIQFLLEYRSIPTYFKNIDCVRTLLHDIESRVMSVCNAAIDSGEDDRMDVVLQVISHSYVLESSSPNMAEMYERYAFLRKLRNCKSIYDILGVLESVPRGMEKNAFVERAQIICKQVDSFVKKHEAVLVDVRSDLHSLTEQARQRPEIQELIRRSDEMMIQSLECIFDTFDESNILTFESSISSLPIELKKRDEIVRLVQRSDDYRICRIIDTFDGIGHDQKQKVQYILDSLPKRLYAIKEKEVRTSCQVISDLREYQESKNHTKLKDILYRLPHHLLNNNTVLSAIDYYADHFAMNYETINGSNIQELMCDECNMPTYIRKHPYIAPIIDRALPLLEFLNKLKKAATCDDFKSVGDLLAIVPSGMETCPIVTRFYSDIKFIVKRGLKLNIPPDEEYISRSYGIEKENGTWIVHSERILQLISLSSTCRRWISEVDRWCVPSPPPQNSVHTHVRKRKRR